MGEAAKPKMQSDFLNSDIDNLEEIKKNLKINMWLCLSCPFSKAITIVWFQMFVG